MHSLVVGLRLEGNLVRFIKKLSRLLFLFAGNGDQHVTTGGQTTGLAVHTVQRTT